MNLDATDRGRKKRPWWRIWLVRVILAIGALLLLVVFVCWWGVRDARRRLVSTPERAAGFEEAMERFRGVQAAEAQMDLLPEGRSILLTHGHKMQRAVVFFHGMTNAPIQFDQLGQVVHARGWNVYIPRLPKHGMADRRTENLSELKAEAMRDCADDAVDLAAGLGDEIDVCGLSAGGTMAAWVAQNRSDVRRCVLLAPALGFARTDGSWLTKFAFVLFPLLPDISSDWIATDPNAPAHCYPGFSSRGLGELLQMAAATYGGAGREAPATRDIALVTSRNDTSVNDVVIWNLVSFWRVKGLPRFLAVDFPIEANVMHDMIDPSQVFQQTETVYPVIVRTLEAP